MYEVFWSIKRRIEKYFYDERYAGRVRLLFFFSLTGVIILLGYNLFEHVDSRAVEDIWRDRFPGNVMLQWVSVRMVRFASYVRYSFRHTIIPVSMFVGVLIASAFYVQDVYLS